MTQDAERRIAKQSREHKGEPGTATVVRAAMVEGLLAGARRLERKAKENDSRGIATDVLYFAARDLREFADELSHQPFEQGEVAHG